MSITGLSHEAGIAEAIEKRKADAAYKNQLEAYNMRECWINVYYYAGLIYGEPRMSKRLASDVSLGSPFKLVYRIHVKLK